MFGYVADVEVQGGVRQRQLLLPFSSRASFSFSSSMNCFGGRDVTFVLPSPLPWLPFNTRIEPVSENADLGVDGVKFNEGLASKLVS